MQRFWGNSFEGIVAETAAGMIHGHNTLFNAKDPILVQNSTALTVGAPGLNISFEQHGSHPRFSLVRLVYMMPRRFSTLFFT